MALQSSTILISCFCLSLFAYLYHIDRAISTTPEEIEKIAGKPWTKEQIQSAYEKVRRERPTFKKDLPPKQNRRYVVFGGAGLVGGWIVEHLVMRGEDPMAIRIADLQAPRRELAIKHGVPFFKTDVTDPSSVAQVFNQPWSAQHASLPLTVFHTVAYIHAGHRKTDLLPRFLQVNVEGTKTVLAAAKSAGCDIFIATSSASVGIKPTNFFFPPWQRYPKTYIQFSDNADPPSLEMANFPGCYAYSKALAEKVVTDADSEEARFRTGAIRPGHAIYGHGDENPNSAVYYYLSRGGLLSWMWHLVLQFVSAQNVSLAHLLYESRIHTHNIGGNAYCVCDPSPPFRYSDMYRLLDTLPHPTTPIKFSHVSPIFLILISYLVEGYITIQRRYAPFLPPATGDITLLQRAMFNYSTINIIYDDSRTKNELGYRSEHGTLEGLCLQVLEWNENVEKKLAMGKETGGVKSEVQRATGVEKHVPVAPEGVAM